MEISWFFIYVYIYMCVCVCVCVYNNYFVSQELTYDSFAQTAHQEMNPASRD